MILGGLLLASSLLFDTDGLLVIVMTMNESDVGDDDGRPDDNDHQANDKEGSLL